MKNFFGHRLLMKLGEMGMNGLISSEQSRCILNLKLRILMKH